MSNRNKMVIFAPLALKSVELNFLAASARDTTPLDPNIHCVQLISTQDCRVEWGAGKVNKVGTAGGTGETVGLSQMVRANSIIYIPIDVAGNTGPVLSVIGQTVDGVLEITPLTE